MTSEPERKQQEAQAGKKPKKRRPVVVRIFRAFKRRYHARKTHYEKERTDEQMARWTRNVGWFTLALVFVGIVTGCIFWRELGVMRGTLDEMRSEQRGQISPVYAEIIGGLTAGKPMTTVVHYVNSGRTAAENFPFGFVKIYSADEWGLTGTTGEAAREIIDYQTKCMALQIADPGTAAVIVYPTATPTTYTFTLATREPMATDDLIRGNSIFVVDGCFIYRTQGKVYHTAVCYFYRFGVTGPASLDYCPVGQRSD